MANLVATAVLILIVSLTRLGGWRRPHAVPGPSLLGVGDLVRRPPGARLKAGSRPLIGGSGTSAPERPHHPTTDQVPDPVLALVNLHVDVKLPKCAFLAVSPDNHD
jgi:hypothetical protein